MRNIYNFLEIFVLFFLCIFFMFLLNVILFVGFVKYLVLKLKCLMFFFDRCCFDYNFICCVS